MWVPALETPSKTFDLLRAHRTPTVTFLRPASKEFDHVGIRDAQATATATEYLVDLGHKYIAYLGGTDMTSVRKERIAGYRQTMAKFGLDTDIVWPSDDNKRSGMNALAELHDAHPEITAIVCNGDMVALGGCLSLIHKGLRPGTDVSIVGFDDIGDAAVATPSLTTMAVSPRKLGTRLARVLLERIREPDMPITFSEVSAELIVRETTAPPRR